MRIAAGIRGTTRIQRISLIAAIGVGALAATGCSYINPQSTTMTVSPSDGVRTDLGKLELRNMVIVSDGNGAEGRLLGAVFNTSQSPITLTVNGAAGAQTQVVVKPGEPVYLTKDSDEALLSTVKTHAGGVETVKLTQTGPGQQTSELGVPVLNAALAEYKGLVPTPSPTAEATSTSTSTATATATATANH